MAAPPVVLWTVVEMVTTGLMRNVGPGSPDVLLFAAPALEASPEPDPETDSVTYTRWPASTCTRWLARPPCTDCDLYTGTLTGSGDTHAWPNADGYVSNSRTGLHQGWLIGPDDAEFDLVLEIWQGRRWRVVASSTGAGSTEELHYVGRAATYRWRVVSERGSGAYELYLSLP